LLAAGILEPKEMEVTHPFSNWVCHNLNQIRGGINNKKINLWLLICTAADILKWIMLSDRLLDGCQTLDFKIAKLTYLRTKYLPCDKISFVVILYKGLFELRK
jgi:hypothetical protein